MERLTNKIEQEIGVFDRDYLRRIQADMFRCSANCCDDVNSSKNELQECLNKCSKPALKADNFIQGQIQELTDRFQRCFMSCADKLKDRASESNERRNLDVEPCIAKCSDEIIELLPTYTKRMKNWLSNGNHMQ